MWNSGNQFVFSIDPEMFKDGSTKIYVSLYAVKAVSECVGAVAAPPNPPHPES